MKVTTILFVLWFIVFLFWMARQFKEYNKRTDRD